MKEPLYRWVCTICGVSDEAESAEMARLNVDVHMGVAHPSSRRAVRVQLDPDRDVLVLDDQAVPDDEDEPGPDA